MTLPRLGGLASRMLLFAAAALVPVLLLMAYTSWLGAEERLARERTRATHLAELLAREQALPFTLGRQLLHSLALTHAVAEPLDEAACRTVLKQAAAENPYVTMIALYSATGNAIQSSADKPVPPVADRDWFRQAIADGGMVVSDYLVGNSSGRPAVAIALPLRDKRGKTTAVLALGIDLAWVGDALARVPMAEGTSIVVVDGHGTILAPAGWLGHSVADHPVFKRISGAAQAVSFEAVGIDGVERTFAARPLNTDLRGRGYLWVATPKDEVTKAALRGFLDDTLLVFVTVLALFAGIWWQGIRAVLRPVRQLREAALRLGGSEFSARTNLPHGTDEIGRLAASFDDMAAKLEARERELERSRESLLRANRALRALTSVKDVAAEATDELLLLDELCRTVAAVGGYRTVYVARAEQDAGKTLTLLAAAGMSQECRERLGTTWEDSERGRGVAATAIRENRILVVHDVASDPRFATCRDLALKAGYRAVIVLPLHVANAVWGVLGLSSAQAGVFDDDETQLLAELAAELGRGIETLRLRMEKRAAETALHQMMEDLERRVAERTTELEDVNRELHAFSYSLSHDLRAPVRSIDGFAGALDDACGAGLSHEGRGYLARIRAAAQRMGDLIEDMIRLAQISNREMLAVPVDLSALAAGIGADLAAAEPLRLVRLTIAPQVTAHGDPGLLRVLLQNLMANAWKYTARVPQPQVEIGSARLATNELAYFVRDNGVGFDMAYADRLFRPFSRLHRAEDYSGTGIGLATVARIARRHGGRVWAEAEKGKGATFYFVLG